MRLKAVAILIEDKVPAFVGVRRLFVKKTFFLLLDTAGGADRNKAVLTIASVFSLHLEHLLPVETVSLMAAKNGSTPCFSIKQKSCHRARQRKSNKFSLMENGSLPVAWAAAQTIENLRKRFETLRHGSRFEAGDIDACPGAALQLSVFESIAPAAIFGTPCAKTVFAGGAF